MDKLSAVLIMSQSRRGFIKSSVAAGLAFSIKPFRRVDNAKYRTALIGSGWAGMNILHVALRRRTSRDLAHFDVGHNQLNLPALKAEPLIGERPDHHPQYPGV